MTVEVSVVEMKMMYLSDLYTFRTVENVTMTMNHIPNKESIYLLLARSLPFSFIPQAQIFFATSVAQDLLPLFFLSKLS